MIRVLLIELEVPTTVRVAELVEQIHEAITHRQPMFVELPPEDVRVYPAQTAALRHRVVSGRPPRQERRR